MSIKAWLTRNIFEETLFPDMFPWVAKLGNIRSKTQTLLPQHTFLGRLNWETLTCDQALFSFRSVKHSGATGETKNRA